MNIRPNEVTVFTSAYLFAHGKRPGGMGHWAFYIGNAPDPVFYPYGLYSTAKLSAQVDAARQGSIYVQVAS